jgi:hypothetical protein
MLVRPAAVGLPLVLAAVVLVGTWRKNWANGFARAGLVLAAALATVAPWEAFIAAETGVFAPLSSSGSLSVYDGLTFAVSDKDYRSPVESPRAAEEFMTAVDARWAAGERAMFRVALEEGLANPTGASQVGLWKIGRAWYATDSQRLDGWLLLLQIPYLVMLVGVSWRSLRSPGDARSLAFLVVGIVGYFWLVTVAVLSILRYMAPAICVWFVLTPAVFKRDR